MKTHTTNNCKIIFMKNKKISSTYKKEKEKEKLFSEIEKTT